MDEAQFREVRRQPYIDLSIYISTEAQLAQSEKICIDNLKDSIVAEQRRTTTSVLANARWKKWQLNFTAGADLSTLAQDLGDVVAAYADHADACIEIDEGDYSPPFLLDQMIDIYVDYLNLLSAAVLLHREDLIESIFSFIEETDYDGEDAILEEIFRRYVLDRPNPDTWYYPQYTQLLKAIDSETDQLRSVEMAKYVRKWYPNMKGKALFWGKHEKIKDDYSPYHGYWAMCAAAFSYLYDIDDSSYCRELVYPADLIEYARTKAAWTGDELGVLPTRVIGGQPCPRAGFWITPSEPNSKKYFETKDKMPASVTSGYGRVIWQWSNDQ